MQSRPDIATIDLTRTRLRLSPDLRFIPQQYGAETFVHIEVCGTSRFYKVGFAEYTFLSLLDGRTAFAQALAMTAQILGADALSQTQALTVYVWLLEHDLAMFADEETTARGQAAGAAAGGARLSLLQRFNPLWLRVPLGRPEPVLRALLPWTGWLFSIPATLLGLVGIALAAATVGSEWTRFSQDAASVFAPHNWLWLLLAWLGLKLVHETAHGLVCLRYGGVVRSMGLVFAFLAPLVWVDATVCWSFRSRWQRIHTAAAGMYAELLVAAAAVAGWTYCESANTAHLLHTVILMASVSTLIFNLNPLMRFDGYYMLSDLLKTPNLASEASQVLAQTLRRVVFGRAGAMPAVAGQQRWLLLAYGVSAGLWRCLVCVSLLIAASVLLHGAGVILTVAGIVVWFGQPLLSGCRLLQLTWQQSPPQFLRGMLVSSGLVAVAGLLLAMPAPILLTAPGVVEYTDGQILRAVTAGFVDMVHVTDGQQVRAGDLIVSLRNDEVVSEYHDLQQLIRQEEIRLQTATRDCQPGAISIAQANLLSLQQKLEEAAARLSGLQLRAAADGQVVGRRLASLPDTYVEAGQELLTIGREDRKELRLSIGQRELSTALQSAERALPVRIGTRPRLQGTLERVNPRATRTLPHPALAASSGGELEVVEAEESVRAGRAETTLQLTEQRFAGVVTLPPEAAVQLRCGERGRVCLGGVPAALGTHLYRSGQRWLQAQLENAARSQ